ncbi:8356_t:CDS:2 [Dentiscutata erythropus]|uniref:8356_t:CDS:1 n=1 Tax=Dentiscutata erythropus TaxID=1348616 RepID=A0A9N8WN86_9GLOM|nr:8356_t:CDS:2 [Dentiscutata erythropus]
MGRYFNAIKRKVTRVFKGRRRRVSRSSTPELRGCSSGNVQLSLPADCLIEIFSHLEDNPKSLQSCVLVNRLWSRSSVPILWAHPFRDSTPSSIIDVYMSYLTDLERIHLVDNGISVSNRRRNQLFDYVSFLRHVSMGSLYTIVLKWTDRTQTTLSSNSKRRSHNTEPSLVMYQALCRLFFSRRSSIRSLSLDWGVMEIWKAYPLLLYSAGIDTYLAKLRQFSIHYITDWSIFGYLAKYSRNIEHLEVLGYSFNIPPHPEDEQNLASLITIQKNLLHFKLFGYATYPVLTLVSLGAQAKSLRSVEISYIHFTSTTLQGPTFEGLAACRNLEELTILNCLNATEEILSPLVCATFPSLRKIHIVESTYGWDNVVVSLIHNNSANLEEVYYKPVDNQQHHIMSPTIIESVAQCCPRIKRLGVPIGTLQISHLTDILTSPYCQLRSLSIFRMDRVSWDRQELWSGLGSLMPTTLRHLNIWIYLGDTPMQLFLQNTQAPLETLYVRWWTHYLGYDYQLVGAYLKDKKVGISEFLRHVI